MDPVATASARRTSWVLCSLRGRSRAFDRQRRRASEISRESIDRPRVAFVFCAMVGVSE